MTASPIAAGMNIDGSSLALGTNNLISVGVILPEWIKVTIPYTALQTAGLTNNALVYTLPIKGIIQQVLWNVTAAFSGGAIATILGTIGTAGSNAKYLASTTMASTGMTAGQSLATGLPESLVSTTAINIYATSTIANLSALTQGSVDIWILTSTLP